MTSHGSQAVPKVIDIHAHFLPHESEKIGGGNAAGLLNLDS